MLPLKYSYFDRFYTLKYSIMYIINVSSTWVLASFQSMPCNLALNLPPPPAITGIAPARLPPKHIKIHNTCIYNSIHKEDIGYSRKTPAYNILDLVQVRHSKQYIDVYRAVPFALVTFYRVWAKFRLLHCHFIILITIIAKLPGVLLKTFGKSS